MFGAEAYLSGWVSNLAGPGTSVGGEVRAGFLAKPEVLVYVSGGGMHFITGGATYGQVGVGVEFAAAEKMTIDIEYKFWQEMGGVEPDPLALVFGALALLAPLAVNRRQRARRSRKAAAIAFVPFAEKLGGGTLRGGGPGAAAPVGRNGGSDELDAARAVGHVGHQAGSAGSIVAPVRWARMIAAASR